LAKISLQKFTTDVIIFKVIIYTCFFP